MAVLMAVRIENSCVSLQETAEGISISLLQSTRVQRIATSCNVGNAPVNRRVVGSSPTSGANKINKIQASSLPENLEKDLTVGTFVGTPKKYCG